MIRNLVQLMCSRKQWMLQLTKSKQKKRKNMKIQSFESFNEKKKQWIKDAIEKPGALKADLGKEDATKKRRLVLAKTLMSLKEHQETDNYMFFGNLKTIKRLVDELLEMDEAELDAILTEHDWASDHVSVATENLEQVFDFLAGQDHSEMEIGAESEIESNEETEDVKRFDSFNQ